MQFGVCKFFCPAMHFELDKIYMCIHCPLTCAYTVPKFTYLVRDKKGTQNRVGYSKKVASRHGLRSPAKAMSGGKKI